MQEAQSSTIQNIKESYSRGVKYFKSQNFKLAIQEFTGVLKPVLSKHLIQKPCIDDCKTELLNAMHHLGKICLAQNNYAEAAAIFQYCSGFAKKYEFDNFDFFLQEAYNTEKKFLTSIGKSNFITVTNKINDYSWY